MVQSVDALISQSGAPAAPEPMRRRFELKFILPAAALSLLLIVIVGIFGIQNNQAGQLLGNAADKNRISQFDEAHKLLVQANGLWSFPATKDEIKKNLAKTEEWQGYQKKIAEATTLMNEKKYTAAIDLLKSIPDDYPGIKAANAVAAKANSLYQAAYRGGSTDDTTKTPTVVTPSPSPTPSSSPTPTKPKTPTTPSPTPTPSPINYIITNSVCRVDVTQATDLYQIAQNFAAACQTNFPLIVQRLSTSPFAPLHQITFVSGSTLSGAAAVTSFANGSVLVSIDYMRSNPSDTGLIVHELVHVVQGYSTFSPSWITEGIADYMRYTLGYATSWSYFHCTSNERYTAGYGCGAALLKYIERVYMPTVVQTLHNTIRAGQYADSFFVSNTGRTIEQLYTQCRSAECSGGQP